MFSRCVVLFLVIFSVIVRDDAYREMSIDGVATILAMENEENVVVNCTNTMPMAYCGILHPNGTRFLFTEVVLNDRGCFTTLPTISKNDSGIWKCHIGKETVGAEIVTKIAVRVTDRLVAVTPAITAMYDNEVTLLCTATTTEVPLRYCRFEPPSGDPFSIDENVTAQEPIFGRYFYPQDKSLGRGDCAVTINNVEYEDQGEWICGAMFKDDRKEYTDILKLEVLKLDTISTGSIIGITFAVLATIIISLVVGYMLWKKYNTKNALQPVPHEEIEVHEITKRESETQDLNVPRVVVHSPSDPSASSSLTSNRTLSSS